MFLKKAVLILMLLCIVSGIFTQEKKSVIEIESYNENNIPSWAHDARRFSIISFGAVPFTILSSTLLYTVGRYLAYDFDPAYAPSIFPTSSSAAGLNKKEQAGILIAGVSLGLAIGITDLIIIKVKEKEDRETIEQKQRETITITPIKTGEFREKEKSNEE